MLYKQKRREVARVTWALAKNNTVHLVGSEIF